MVSCTAAAAVVVVIVVVVAAVVVVVAVVAAAAVASGEVTSAVERIGTNARSHWGRTSLSWYAEDFCHLA